MRKSWLCSLEFLRAFGARTDDRCVVKFSAVDSSDFIQSNVCGEDVENTEGIKAGRKEGRKEALKLLPSFRNIRTYVCAFLVRIAVATR